MNQVVKKFLQGVGDKNKYQVLLVIFLFFIALETNYLMIGPTFIFMNPLFRCTFSDQLVDESQACSSLNQCHISNQFTLVAHMELYCDKQAQRNIIQSIIPIGSIVGLLVINSLSDIKGRKFALIFVQIVGIAGVALTILGGFLQALWLIIVAQFLCGFCGYTMLMMVYVIQTQFCEDMFRQKSLIAINFALSTGTIIIGVLYYFYNLWYNYLIFIVLISMVTFLLISIFFLVEGPYFLYSKKRIQECLQSLKTIAKYNNKNEQFQTLSIDFPPQNTQQNENKAPSILSIIKDKRYLKMIIILIFAELGANLYYFATGYAQHQIGYEYGVNMIGAGIVDFLCYITLSLTITKIPRKSGLIIFYGVTVALGFLFFIDTIKDQRINSFILLSVIRYFFILGFTLILVVLTTEAFPMNIQATCAGIIEAIAQIGSFLGPIIITFCTNLQFYPIIAISILALVTIQIPLLFMDTPQIQSTQLRQTNQQIELAQTNQNMNTILTDQRILEMPSPNVGSEIFRNPIKMSID